MNSFMMIVGAVSYLIYHEYELSLYWMIIPIVLFPIAYAIIYEFIVGIK